MMKLPDASLVRQYLALPWQIDAGSLEDGVRFARCREIPHAVAFAEPGENLDELFWDSLRASIEAMLATGEPIPTPARMPRMSAPRGYVVVEVDRARSSVVTGQNSSYGLATSPANRADDMLAIG